MRPCRALVRLWQDFRRRPLTWHGPALNRHRQLASGGVCAATIRRWQAQPHFCAALDAARESSFNEALKTLRHAAGAAVARLERTLRSKDQYLATNAAKTLLSFALQAHSTLEIEQRISVLEAAITRVNGQRYEN